MRRARIALHRDSESQFRETGEKCGPFDLALHAWDEPAETLVRLATEQGLRIITPSLGQVVEPSQLEGPTPWWRDLESK